MVQPEQGLFGGAGFKGTDLGPLLVNLNNQGSWTLNHTTPGPATLPTLLTITVPANEIWVPVFINHQWQTGATAGNRFAQLQHQDGSGNILLAEVAMNVQPPSTTKQYLWMLGSTPVFGTNLIGANDIIQTPLPEKFTMLAGHKLIFTFIGGQSGDNILCNDFVVRKYATTVGN